MFQSLQIDPSHRILGGVIALVGTVSLISAFFMPMSGTTSLATPAGDQHGAPSGHQSAQGATTNTASGSLDQVLGSRVTTVYGTSSRYESSGTTSGFDTLADTAPDACGLCGFTPWGGNLDLGIGPKPATNGGRNSGGSSGDNSGNDGGGNNNSTSPTSPTSQVSVGLHNAGPADLNVSLGDADTTGVEVGGQSVGSYEPGTTSVTVDPTNPTDPISVDSTTTTTTTPTDASTTTTTDPVTTLTDSVTTVTDPLTNLLP